MLSRGRSPKWRSPNAFIPSLNDSSEPAESRITLAELVGSSMSRRASASRRMTAVALSFAPGTTSRAPISAIAAA